MWIAAAQFQDGSAKFVRKRLTQVFALFAPGIQADFKFEKIGRNLIGHNISSRGKESVALDDNRNRAIRHDGLPKGDGAQRLAASQEKLLINNLQDLRRWQVLSVVSAMRREKEKMWPGLGDCS